MSTMLLKNVDIIELTTDVKILDEIEKIEDIDIKHLLKTMNKRISLLYNRDHIIGHIYFIGLLNKSKDESKKELANIFRKRVIPLLKHYFKNDWEKIRVVLGDDKKEEKYQFIKKRETLNLKDLIEEDKSYELNDLAFLDIQSYKKIYQNF